MTQTIEWHRVSASVIIFTLLNYSAHSAVARKLGRAHKEALMEAGWHITGLQTWCTKRIAVASHRHV